MAQDNQRIYDQVYALNGGVERLAALVGSGEKRMSEHLDWSERMNTRCENSNGQVTAKLAKIDRRLDKIEWKVGIMVSAIVFTLQHVDWIVSSLKNAVALAMGNG